MSFMKEYKPRDKDQPLDTVSCIIWDPYKSKPTFVTGSWDGFVRMYLVQSTGSNYDINKIWNIFLQHPVLCVDINQNAVLFAGLASGNVVAIDIATSNIVSLGTHDAPICGIFWMKQYKLAMSLGYDNCIKFWSIEQNNPLLHEVKLPLKTVTCSYDFPYLLIGSIETTIAILNMKNMQNVNYPQSADRYMKINLEKFSKFNCSRVMGGEIKKGIMGTIDGRCAYFTFKQSYDSIVIPSSNENPLVSRCQKKDSNSMSSKNVLVGQVNAVDIGYFEYQNFTLMGGSQDLATFNVRKKMKSKTYTNINSTTGATTAARLSPRLDYLAIATGTDWLKGLHELQNIKKPKITVFKIASNDLQQLIMKQR